MISQYTHKIVRKFLILVLVFAWIFSGYPQIWQNPRVPPEIQVAQAAISIGTPSTGAADTSALTISSHDGSGTDTLLVVGVSLDDTANDKEVTSITYAGNNLSILTETDGGGNKGHLEVWYLAGTSGTGDIVVTINGGNSQKMAVGVITYTGVDQTTPIDTGSAVIINSSGNCQSGTSVTVTTESGDVVADAVTWQNGPLNGNQANQTEQWDVEMGGSGASSHYGGGSTQAGADGGVMSWGGVSGSCGQVGFNINAAAAAASVPSVTTNAATSITATSATMNGDITADGGASITEHGFTWGTNSALSGGDTATTTLGAGSTGTYSEGLTGLDPSTTYYFRAYATNSGGTGYGSILNFTTNTASLTFTVSSDAFPGITPSTAVFATTTLSINTDNPSGWNVTVARDDSDTTLDLDTDATVNITDQTAWVPGAATTTAGNAVRISSLDSSGDVLAMRVMTASGTVAFISTAWWGISDSYIDSATTLWAGFNSTAQKIGDSSVSCSGANCALNTVLYYLDVPSTQRTGAYSGGITYTATMNP